jgi:acylphosphatase
VARQRLEVLISGRVQGVWFRASTRDEARRRGLDGWVRNLPDGRVEALFEGDAPALEGMLDWCRVGPPGARVDAVETVRGPAPGAITGFVIIR